MYLSQHASVFHHNMEIGVVHWIFGLSICPLIHFGKSRSRFKSGILMFVSNGNPFSNWKFEASDVIQFNAIQNNNNLFQSTFKLAICALMVCNSNQNSWGETIDQFRTKTSEHWHLFHSFNINIISAQMFFGFLNSLYSISQNIQ